MRLIVFVKDFELEHLFILNQPERDNSVPERDRIQSQT